jgi:hypothetical protein
LALALGLLTGCHQIRDEYTLNPDGSGKVRLSRLTPGEPNLMRGSRKLDPQAEALKAAGKLVEKARGVDAWKDVAWEVTGEGKVLVTATAYFSDISKLKLGSQEGRVRLERGAGGRIVLHYGKKPSKAQKPREGGGKNGLSGKELEKAVLAKKMEWQQARGMMTAMLTGMVLEVTFRLPGKLESTSCFRKLGKDRARLTVKGEDMLRFANALAARDEFWRRQAQGKVRGDIKDLDVPEFLEKVFGSREPPRIECSGATAALFDYAKEVAEARKAMPELMKKLAAATRSRGPAPRPKIEPAKAGDGLARLWVTAVNRSLEADLPKSAGLWHSGPACELKLLGKLPGRVVKIENGEVEQALAADGTSMLPEKAFDRKTRSASLQGNNRDYVQFGIKLKPLPDGADSIKQVSGHLIYTAASGSRKVDLGEIKLARSATGKVMGARVTTFSKRSGSVTLELDVKEAALIRGVTCRSQDGKDLGATLSRTYSWGNKSRVSLTVPGAVPAAASFEIELYAKTEKRKMPFKLESLKVR